MKKYMSFAVAKIVVIAAILTVFIYASIANNKEITETNRDTSKLITEALPDGKTKVINNLTKTELTIPNNYTVYGNPKNYTIAKTATGANESTDTKDFAQLQISLLPINGNLALTTAEDYMKLTQSEAKTPNLNEIYQIEYQNIGGFSFVCPFLVRQECMYLQLKNDQNNYLYVLKNFSDVENKGYDLDLVLILNSLKFIE